MPDRTPQFPSYTAAEDAADRIVHLVGLATAAAAAGWLLGRIWPAASARQLASVSIYCAGLLGMLSASTVYNVARPGRLKAVLRRLDHSMIFVMIAGSYTPFALGALPPQVGVPLCAVVWGLAVVGIGLKLACPHRCELASLALYLGMGWLVLGVVRSLFAVLPGSALSLLLIGGLVYSLGTLVRARAGLPFHNAIWHAMVVAAAALHFAAVAEIAGGQG